MKKLENLEKSIGRVNSYLTSLVNELDNVPYPYLKLDSKDGIYFQDGVLCSREMEYGLEFELKYRDWSKENQLKGKLEQIMSYPILKERLEQLLEQQRANEVEKNWKSMEELSRKMMEDMGKSQEKEEEEQPPYNPCPGHCPFTPIK